MKKKKKEDELASCKGKRIASIGPKSKVMFLTPLTKKRIRKSLTIVFTDGTKLRITPGTVRQGDYIGSGDDEAHYTVHAVLDIEII